MKPVTDDELDELKREAMVTEDKAMIEALIIRRDDIVGYMKCAGSGHDDELFAAVVDMIAAFLEGVDSPDEYCPKCLSCDADFVRGRYPHAFIMLKASMVGMDRGQNVLVAGVCAGCSVALDDDKLNRLAEDSAKKLWPGTDMISAEYGRG